MIQGTFGKESRGPLCAGSQGWADPWEPEMAAHSHSLIRGRCWREKPGTCSRGSSEGNWQSQPLISFAHCGGEELSLGCSWPDCWHSLHPASHLLHGLGGWKFFFSRWPWWGRKQHNLTRNVNKIHLYQTEVCLSWDCRTCSIILQKNVKSPGTQKDSAMCLLCLSYWGRARGFGPCKCLHFNLVTS